MIGAYLIFLASSKCFLQEASFRGAFPSHCALAFFPTSRVLGNYLELQGCNPLRIPSWNICSCVLNKHLLSFQMSIGTYFLGRASSLALGCLLSVLVNMKDGKPAAAGGPNRTTQSTSLRSMTHIVSAQWRFAIEVDRFSDKRQIKLQRNIQSLKFDTAYCAKGVRKLLIKQTTGGWNTG